MCMVCALKIVDVNYVCEEGSVEQMTKAAGLGERQSTEKVKRLKHGRSLYITGSCLIAQPTNYFLLHSKNNFKLPAMLVSPLPLHLPPFPHT